MRPRCHCLLRPGTRLHHVSLCPALFDSCGPNRDSFQRIAAAVSSPILPSLTGQLRHHPNRYALLPDTDPEWRWYNPGPSYANPLVWMFVVAFLQACTHYAEDLPPRVSGDIMWTDKRMFFCGSFNEGALNQCRDLSYRLFRGLVTIVFGMIDEFIASPRLLPLFWGLVPVFAVAQRCRFTGPTITRIRAVYDMSHRALERQPLLTRQQRVYWNEDEQRLEVAWEHVDVDPENALCWLGKMCDSQGVDPDSWSVAASGLAPAPDGRLFESASVRVADAHNCERSH